MPTIPPTSRHLEQLPLPDPGGEPPPEIARLLALADQRIQDHMDRVDVPPSPGFLAADHEASWRALQQIAARGLAPGRRFCEWGSGFGVVTALAACAGFEACGIELWPHLVDEARALAGQLQLDLRFAVGSFVPEGTPLPDTGTAFTAATPGEAADGHAALGTSMDQFDLIYVYTGPGEEELLREVFTRHARPGALLLSYDGEDWLELRVLHG